MKRKPTLLIALLFLGALITTIHAGADWYDGYDGTDPNTVGLWQFDETSGDTAYNAVAGNDGTLEYDATFASGKFGNALTLDGTQDNMVIVPYNEIVFINQSFTIEFWMKPDENSAAQGWMNPFHKDGAQLFEYDPNTNRLYFHLYAGGLNSELLFTIPGQVNGVWTHIAGTYDHMTGQQSIWVNGVRAATKTADNSMNDMYEHPVRVGSYSQNPDLYAFYGQIDELRISNVARTFDSVAGPINPDFQWFYGYYGTPDAHTLAIWHLDENSGSTTANELTGNDGTLEYNATWGNGRFGSAVVLDGVQDNVMIPDYGAINVDMTSLTVEFWMKPDVDSVGSGWMFPFHKEGGQLFEYNPDNGDLWFSINFAGVRSSIKGEAPNLNGTWIHVAGTYDLATNTQSIYVNGQLLNSMNPPSPMRDDYANPIRLGTWGTNVDVGGFYGLIDEVRISDIARTFVSTDYALVGYADVQRIGPGIKITWDTKAGQGYDIEWKDPDGVWASMGLFIEGTDDLASYTDLGDQSAGRSAPSLDGVREYRVKRIQ